MSAATKFIPAGTPSKIATRRGPCDSPEVTQRSRLIRAASVAFDKYEGLGNDFVVIDAANEDAIDLDAARAICDRRFGVGADGVLLVLPPRDSKNVARMRVVNADGSIPEMCGNGLRCVALHVARTRGNGSGVYETDAGLRECNVEKTDDETLVAVDMGIVKSLGPKIVEVDGEEIEVRIGDAGNPHAVIFRSVDEAIPIHRGVDRLGPRIEKHRDFPDGINVNFALFDRRKPTELHLVVWERGVGRTLACGTGACATVAVGCDTGLLEWATPTKIHLPGGTLEITVEHSGACKMRGPARHVFSGKIP
ncbi:MAG: diaminopimelate epimerase [Polyangiaceae bacterium]